MLDLINVGNAIKEKCFINLVLIAIIINVGYALDNRLWQMWKNQNAKWLIAERSTIFISRPNS